MKLLRIPSTRVSAAAVLVLGGIVSLSSNAARADGTSGASGSLYALHYEDDASANTRDAWRFTLGAGVASMPSFPGSNSRKTEAFPAVGASRGSFFIGVNPDAGALLSLGAYFVGNETWRAGVAVTYDFIEPRDESDDAHLYGLGDIDRTTHAELFGIYTHDWVSLRGSVTSDIGGNSRGAVATLDLTGRYQPDARWVFTAGPGLSWVTSQYSRTYFGVTPQQSMDSGLPAYRAGSGLNNVRFSLAGAYRPTPHWNIGGAATASWLQGDASDSPVTQKSSQTTYTLFANYLF
jgi:outer membrane protein